MLQNGKVYSICSPGVYWLTNTVLPKIHAHIAFI